MNTLSEARSCMERLSLVGEGCHPQVRTAPLSGRPCTSYADRVKLMYLEPERVRELFVMIADRFGAELVFDTVPRWFANLTMLGLQQTASYRLPSMPWGINRDEIEPTLRRWHERVGTVKFLPYRSPRGLPNLFARMANRTPVARHAVPALVHVTMVNAGQSTLPAGTWRDFAPGRGLEKETLLDVTLRQRSIKSADDNDSTLYMTGGLLAAAIQNFRCGDDIGRATTRVITKRVALGRAATLNPLKADHAESSWMVPGKVGAFSTAGMVMLKQSGQANRHMMRLASGEVMATARATMEMTGYCNPAALVETHDRYARAWFSRVASSWIAIGVRAFEVRSAAIAPIRRVVVANAERLAR